MSREYIIFKQQTFKKYLSIHIYIEATYLLYNQGIKSDQTLV